MAPKAEWSVPGTTIHQGYAFLKHGADETVRTERAYIDSCIQLGKVETRHMYNREQALEAERHFHYW
jgi:hypothetical protein